VLTPDDFLAMQIDIDQPTFLTGVKNIRNRLKDPPFAPQEFIDSLLAQGLSKTAEALAQWVDLI